MLQDKEVLLPEDLQQGLSGLTLGLQVLESQPV